MDGSTRGTTRRKYLGLYETEIHKPEHMALYRPQTPSRKCSRELKEQLERLCAAALFCLDNLIPQRDPLVGYGLVTQIGQYSGLGRVYSQPYFELLWIGNEAGESQRRVRNALGNEVWDGLYEVYQRFYAELEEFISLDTADKSWPLLDALNLTPEYLDKLPKFVEDMKAAVLRIESALRDCVPE